MTKKVKHAEEPAGGKPDTELENQPAAGTEQEAAALVEGDGAAVSGGAEHAGEPSPAAVGADEQRLVDADVPYGQGTAASVEVAQPGPNDLGDGSGFGADAAGEAVSLAGVGSDRSHEGGNGSDGDGGGGSDGSAQDADAQGLTSIDVGWPEFVRDDVKFVEVLPHEGMTVGDQVMTYVEGVYTVFEWLGEPPHWEQLAQLGEPHPPETVDLRAGNVDAAIAAAAVAYDQALRIIGAGDFAAWQVREQYPELVALTREDYAEAARLLREIGHARATTAVVATQLKIRGLRTLPLEAPETIALETFLFTLVGLDGLADQLARAIAKELEARLRKPAPPVPVDETTMEPVDDALATW